MRDHGVRTRRALAEVPLPIPCKIEGTHPESLEKVREQARLQVEGEREGKVLSEFLLPLERWDNGTLKPNLGLLALPEPSPGDLFLDIEGAFPSPVAEYTPRQLLKPTARWSR